MTPLSHYTKYYPNLSLEDNLRGVDDNLSRQIIIVAWQSHKIERLSTQINRSWLLVIGLMLMLIGAIGGMR